jgi:predicted  nucleic acid-binding Zn-ribbon protein
MTLPAFVVVGICFIGGIVGWHIPEIQAWLRSWKKPGKPIETFFDDSPPKAEGKGVALGSYGKPIAPQTLKVTPEYYDNTERRLFWLEQEFRKFLTLVDQFHPLKSAVEELRGMVKKVESDFKTIAPQNMWLENQRRLAGVEETVNRLDRQLINLGSELTTTIETTKKFQQTLEHILKTRVSEENFEPLKRTVGRQDTDITLLKAQVKKLEFNLPFEMARQTEAVNALRKEVTGTRTIVNTLQGAQFDGHTRIEKRIGTLEQARTDESKLFDAAKQSADIKQLANFEVREAIKGQIADLRANRDSLADELLKKLAVEFQEIADRRYVKVPTKPVRKKAAPKAKAEKKADKAIKQVQLLDEKK